MTLLDVDTTADGSAVRLALRGELDISTSPRLEKELEDAEAGEPGTIVLDLRELDFMDSTGLRVVVSADARARERGRRLVVVRGRDAVQRLFRITRLDERLDMVDDPAGAQAP